MNRRKTEAKTFIIGTKKDYFKHNRRSFLDDDKRCFPLFKDELLLRGNLFAFATNICFFLFLLLFLFLLFLFLLQSNLLTISWATAPMVQSNHYYFGYFEIKEITAQTIYYLMCEYKPTIKTGEYPYARPFFCFSLLGCSF